MRRARLASVGGAASRRARGRRLPAARGLERFARYGGEGRRTLGLAYRHLGADTRITKASEVAMTFLGFLLEPNQKERIVLALRKAANVVEAAARHCAQGIGVRTWASNDQGAVPDVVMACCGDVPTLETLAAVSILRERLPALKVRVVNVVESWSWPGVPGVRERS